MKIQAGDTQIVIGKRVTVGGCAFSVASTLAAIFPDHAAAIVASVGAVTFIAQVIIGHFASITTK